jgi:hypothetical protein
MISQRAVLGFGGIGSSKAAIITKSLARRRLASAMATRPQIHRAACANVVKIQ